MTATPAIASPLFTVFTPTFNRATTLSRVYDSLRQQSTDDFEWLIVDDGSSDATRSIVEGWQREAPFSIRYVHQANQGKHVAFNRGVREARGELFLPFDSDDACTPDALERFAWHWRQIPEAERDRYSAVTVLCRDQYGHPIGRRFPGDIVDSDSLDIRYRHGVTGEKWGFHRTEVLRQFPFPEELKRTYVPEDVVWTKIARRYRTRYVNETLRIYYTEPGSMVRSGDPSRNARGGCLSSSLTLNEHTDFFRFRPLEFGRAAVLYSRFSFHVGIGPSQQWAQLRSRIGRLLWATTLPVGYAVYRRDRHRTTAQ
jgi:glycosyltransferase involved in cell wall biosynthesis